MVMGLIIGIQSDKRKENTNSVDKVRARRDLIPVRAGLAT